MSSRPGREGVDVLVVEGGDEGPVEGAHDLVRDLVALVLEGLDLPLTRREVRHVGEGLLEQAAERTIVAACCSKRS